MNAASLERSLSKNQGCFPAQEVEKYFKNQEVSCEQG